MYLKSDTEIVWVKSVCGVWGMGHSFADKLCFTREIPEGRWVPKHLLAPVSAKPPATVCVCRGSTVPLGGGRGGRHLATLPSPGGPSFGLKRSTPFWKPGPWDRLPWGGGGGQGGEGTTTLSALLQPKDM